MTPKKFAKLYKEHSRSIRAVARSAGVSYHMARKAFLEASKRKLIEPRSSGGPGVESHSKPTVDGRLHAIPTSVFSLPKKGKIKRYLFTSAQNNTYLHKALWRNLLALAKNIDAQLMVARFAYIKQGLGASGDKADFINKQGRRPKLYDGEGVWWDRKLLPYLHDTRAEVAPGLVWCGDMNILPTAVRPLSGLESHTGRLSGIFPHVKFSMVSVPSGKHEATKFNYTTGAVTLRNYIQRKAGLKAEFHHCYGALIVEVDSDGNWFVRQLNADSDGTIHDLDMRVKDGKVTTGCRVEAVSWGDVHTTQIDEVVKKLAWGEGGMLDVLRPKYQFMHDVFDFKSRNHHDRRDHHKMYEKHQLCQDNVENELTNTALFMENTAARKWCIMEVVESNHDNALERWLRDEPGWYARDPENALIFLKLQTAKYKALGAWTAEDRDFLLVEHALKEFGGLSDKVAHFLREDESFVICHDKSGGIETGMHGHLGPNGSRGNAISFARMGRKATTGHTHTAGIVDGIYVAGTSSNLDMGYNRGPSSWSHSHVVTYPNGKRAIITMWNGKWRA